MTDTTGSVYVGRGAPTQWASTDTGAARSREIRARGLCARTPLAGRRWDPWYGPDDAGWRGARARNAARRACAGCPVTQLCRDEARALEQHCTPYGVWGGLSSEERRAHDRAAAAAAFPAGGAARSRTSARVGTARPSVRSRRRPRRCTPGTRRSA